MLAISPERGIIARHDAIVETVVRDRIVESKKAERYRLAWKSACQGRRAWWDSYGRAMGQQVRQQPVPWENCTCGRIAVGTYLTDMRNWNPSCPGHGLKSEWYNSEERPEVRNMRRENSLLIQELARRTREKTELKETCDVLGDDHALAWQNVRELKQELAAVRGERDHVVREMQESALHLKNEELKRDADKLRKELSDLRLAFSELQGAQVQEEEELHIGVFPGVVACYNTIHCANWGFCHRCAPQLYAEVNEWYKAAGGASSLNPSLLYADIIKTIAAGRIHESGTGTPDVPDVQGGQKA